MVNPTPSLPGGVRSAYPWTGQWLEVDGGRMHYLDEGPKDAPIMLCVHGNPTWSFYWRSLVEHFAGQYRVVVPDHIGCGLSDKPQDWDYRLAQHVGNLQQLVEHLDADDITLVVYDWGGAIGMGVATAQPERFAGLSFNHFFLQPMDGPVRDANTDAAIRYCLAHPGWRLSLQTHKVIGLR